MDQTRAERNQNPGNINYVIANPFKGQIGIEDIPQDEPLLKPRFGKYDTIHNGIRAIAKVLISYMGRDKCDTIRKIVNRWAPPIENNIFAYVYDVAKNTSILPDTHLELNDTTLIALTKALIHHENGRCLYDDTIIASAIEDALGE